MIEPDSRDVARRAVRLAAILTLLLVITGTVAVYVVAKYQLWRRSIFYEQYGAIEAPGLAIVGLFAVGVLVWLARPGALDEPTLGDAPAWARSRWFIPALALGVLIVAAAGTHLAFHNYPFADDEYSGWFQAVIFSQGQKAVTLAQPWCTWAHAMAPTSIDVAPPCTWYLGYLPIHAMIRGAFMAARIDVLAEPTMAALSVVLLAMLVRRIWPDRPGRAVLAATLLAAATQFLVMAMTPFSMSSHLFFSLVWLNLYFAPQRWALIALPWVSVLALGLHSPTPHCLFAAPLILRYLVERRFVAFLYVGLAFSFGLMFWGGGYIPSMFVGSMPIAQPTAVIDAMGSTVIHPAGDGPTASMMLVLLTTWTVPVALPAVLVALLRWKDLDAPARWLAFSLVFTLAFRGVFVGSQGIGWGNRYAFAVLGNYAVLAAIGVEGVAEALGRRRTRRLIAAALVAAVVVELPMRGAQAERIIRPYWRTWSWLVADTADIVVFPSDMVKWGRTMVRNDPYLRNHPKLFNYSELGEVGVDSLKAQKIGSVRVITVKELRQFGLKPITRFGRFETVDP